MTDLLTNADPPENTSLTLEEALQNSTDIRISGPVPSIASKEPVIRIEVYTWPGAAKTAKKAVVRHPGDRFTFDMLAATLGEALGRPVLAPEDPAELRAAITEWAGADAELDVFALDQSNAYGDDHRAAESRLERAEHTLHVLARNLKKPETESGQ